MIWRAQKYDIEIEIKSEQLKHWDGRDIQL